MDFLAQLITWINVITNALGKYAFGIIAILPGWLSNTIISAVTGIILLFVFKHTSNQKAISKVRDSIKANTLALKLFKDSISVTLKSQGQVFKGAILLLIFALVPMLVMIVPVSLLLSQLGLWYQAKPLMSGQEALVTVQLSGKTDSPWPNVNLQPSSAADVTVGPVRVFSKRQVYWKIKAKENGLHNLIFNANEQQVKKQLALGQGFMRISLLRPSWNWGSILLHPMEKPLKSDSIIQSISIDYPDRPSKTSGTGWWLIYFFIASMVFALIFKPILKVKI